MSVSGAYSWLRDAVAREAVVLASSRRLARELREHHDAVQIASGARAWATPPIHYWQDWLAEQLGSALTDSLPQLLDPASATLLWEQSLDRTGRQDLLSITGVVRHAQSAWARLQDWNVSQDAVAAAAMSRDELWYLRAAQAYSERLASSNWIDAAQLAAQCEELVKDPACVWPGQIVHAGFDRATPAMQRLFDALAAGGVQIAPAPAPARDAERSLRSYPDSTGLWRAAGRWARQILDEDPDARVAIVAPDLETQAATIVRLVREGFAPGWQRGGERYRQSVNVSYGRRLADFPAVATALQCLGFAANGASSADISVLLRSPFLGTIDSADRARLELKLRQLPDRRWMPPDLRAAIFSDGPNVGTDALPRRWLEQYESVESLHDMRTKRQAPATWAGQIDASLAGFGWPGKAALDSEEFQLVNRWRQLLNQLASLDRLESKMTLAGAVRQLQRIASDTVYQPEALGGAVSVLGVLETAGLEFDHLWVGGMDARQWPPAGNSLALVSRQLQVEHGMPDARPSDTLKFAQRTLARLQESADRLCFAWSRSDGDNELMPSPMLDLGDSRIAHDVDDPGWFAAREIGTGRLQRVEHDPAPPVLADEKIHGGAYTVQCMREEPFAAFVNGRLVAGSLDTFAPGLTPRLRGNLVHDALQALLQDCAGQTDLLRWNPDELEQRAEQAAYRAQAALARQADPILRRVLALEKRRLQQMLVRFIGLERQREPFSIVALERNMQLQRGSVRLDLRIDRIDRLQRGGLLLADYKTGANKKFLGQDRMPKTVQMSVYACAVDDPVEALAFINIDSREITYDGAGAGFKSGRTQIADEDWQDALASWCAEVDALLARFADGEVGVNTLQAADKARPLAVLSRVAELRRDG